MYNRVHSAQKQLLVLKSYLPGIYSFIGPKRHYYNFCETILNESHEWIDKQPNVIKSPNVSDSIIFKLNRTLVKK